ncbi:phage holin family protein [Sphingorhabdus sp.]|uniref:phage holin family protein n=1 Tax=Sphingorhabdus sp. TaxID=1902408 RepID=UPI003593ECC2
MTDDHHSNSVDRSDGQSAASPVEQITLVLDDVRALVKAELRYFQSRLDYSRYVMKWSLLFGMIAIVTLSGAAIALILGTLLTLATHIGPGWATFVTVLGFLIIGLTSGFAARHWMKKVHFTEIENDNDDRT